MPTVYVDPSCMYDGDGTVGSPCATSPGGVGPRNTWAGMEWISGVTYAQKAGSTYYGMIDVMGSGINISERITITTYGSGPRPIIDGNGQQFGIYLRGAVSHITVHGLEVRGVNAGVGNRFLVRLGNGPGEEANDVILSDMVIHSPIDPGGANEANGIWGYCANCTLDHVQIYNIPSDGIWLANVGNFIMRDCYIHHVATSGRNTGDCVQLGGTASTITVKNNILDHSSTEAKQCLGDFTLGGNGGVVEDNTIIMSTSGDQSVTSKALTLSVDNLVIRRNIVRGGDWVLSYSGNGEIYDNEFSDARSVLWQFSGADKRVHAFRNKFIASTGGVIGLNASNNLSEIRLTDNVWRNLQVAIQRGGTVRILDQCNTFWANVGHAVGTVLDSSNNFSLPS